ncbi:MAG TPA: hypothetical protein VIP77_17760 [Jiangellaceae bacterium]
MTGYTDSHTPLQGVIHQPADTYVPSPAAVVTEAPTASYLPALVPQQQPGQPPAYPMQMVLLSPQQPQPTAAGLSPITSRLLVGAGIGAGAILAVALIGPLIIATLQSLAVAALALGGAGLGLGVAALAVSRNLRH